MRPERQARLHRAVDLLAGEAVRIVPYTGGGYLVGTPDPTRPVKDIVGTVTDVPKSVRASGSGANTGHNAELRTATHTVTFTTKRLPYTVTAGDHAVLPARGGLTLQVESTLPFGTGRTILLLKAIPTT